MLRIKTNYWPIENIVERENISEQVHISDITITSIKVSMPEFSIWDTVMIVDTGETGEIEFIYTKDDSVRIIWNGKYSFAKINNLVKIPTFLINKLQD